MSHRSLQSPILACLGAVVSVWTPSVADDTANHSLTTVTKEMVQRVLSNLRDGRVSKQVCFFSKDKSNDKGIFKDANYPIL